MNPEYERILEKSKSRQKEIHRQMLHLSHHNKKGFDQMVAAWHTEVFNDIDCLQCGNCCRLIGPRFRDKDIKVLGKETGLTYKAFVGRYLVQDGDTEFFLLRKLPCPFLKEDNSCSDYDKRPLSCEEYPYTQSRNIQRHLVRLGHSAMICPAAALIVQKVLDEFK